MNLLLRFIKYLNSTAGILILAICWMIVFILVISQTSIEESGNRYKDLFIPVSLKTLKKKFQFSSDNFPVSNLPSKYEEQKQRSNASEKENNINKWTSGEFTNKIIPLNGDTIEKKEFGNSFSSVYTNELEEGHSTPGSTGNHQSSSLKKIQEFHSDKIQTSSKKIPNEDEILQDSDKEFTIHPLPNDPNAPGEGGRPYEINKNELTPDERREYEFGWQNHQFNLFASDRISVRRSLPDRRSWRCKHVNYTTKLPSTSVIIVFHNEAWSTLLRTVHSILDRSPSNLIKEVILVDDASTFENLGIPLEKYMKLLNKVKIKRTNDRIGLMKARIIGAAEATGEVLTFLDAHIECHPGWLEPLLDRIMKDNKTVVSPVIDSISDNTFEAIHIDDSSLSVGIFDWTMQFNWKSPSSLGIYRENLHDPIKTPAIAGGLFSIQREYFYYLGAYDPGMKIWGSENIEMSIRVWMCGGRLEIHPCSHVGHIYRNKSPYSWEESVDKILTINQRRLVDVWLDEYKEIYYAIMGNKHKYDPGDITDRKKLRNRLKCHSFNWYLENVFPTLYNPLKSLFMGSIENVGLRGFCLDTGSPNSRHPKLYQCHHQGGNQLWILSSQRFLRTINKCFSFHEIEMYMCNSDPNDSRWTYDEKNFLLHDQNQFCLSSNSNQGLEIQKCSLEKPNIFQKWILKSLIDIKLPYKSNEDNL